MFPLVTATGPAHAQQSCGSSLSSWSGAADNATYRGSVRNKEGERIWHVVIFYDGGIFDSRQGGGSGLPFVVLSSGDYSAANAGQRRFHLRIRTDTGTWLGPGDIELYLLERDDDGDVVRALMPFHNAWDLGYVDRD